MIIAACVTVVLLCIPAVYILWHNQPLLQYDVYLPRANADFSVKDTKMGVMLDHPRPNSLKSLHEQIFPKSPDVIVTAKLVGPATGDIDESKLSDDESLACGASTAYHEVRCQSYITKGGQSYLYEESTFTGEPIFAVKAHFIKGNTSIIISFYRSDASKVDRHKIENIIDSLAKTNAKSIKTYYSYPGP